MKSQRQKISEKRAERNRVRRKKYLHLKHTGQYRGKKVEARPEVPVATVVKNIGRSLKKTLLKPPVKNRAQKRASI